MEALALAAALFGVDAEVRGSEAFMLAGQLATFPPQFIIDRNRELAAGHLRWYRGLRNEGITIDPWYEKQQDLIDDAYLAVGNGRRNLEWHFLSPSDTFWLKAARGNIATLRRLLGDEDYIFGRMPAPLPCMEPVCPHVDKD